jgi:hypothetical protein
MFLKIFLSALELIQACMDFISRKQDIDAGKAEARDEQHTANEQAAQKANAAREAQRQADAGVTGDDASGLRDDGFRRD